VDAGGRELGRSLALIGGGSSSSTGFSKNQVIALSTSLSNRLEIHAYI
jgi:hypothetical protein